MILCAHMPKHVKKKERNRGYRGWSPCCFPFHPKKIPPIEAVPLEDASSRPRSLTRALPLPPGRLPRRGSHDTGFAWSKRCFCSGSWIHCTSIACTTILVCIYISELCTSKVKVVAGWCWTITISPVLASNKLTKSTQVCSYPGASTSLFSSSLCSYQLGLVCYRRTQQPFINFKTPVLSSSYI